MTNKEAIEQLKRLREYEAEDDLKALDLAIKALKGQRPQGKWLHPYITDIACECSNCNLQLPITDYFNFCPNCGAYMRKGDED